MSAAQGAVLLAEHSSGQGPKVLQIRYRYFRIAYMALIRGAGMLFRSAVHTKQRQASDDALTIEVSWV